MKRVNLLLPLSVLLFLLSSCEGEVFENSSPSIPTHRYSDNHTCEELTPTFKWESTDDDGDELTFTVRLGESESNLIEIASGLKEQAYAFTEDDGLEERSVYYWQVTVNDGNSAEVSSPVWKFTTLQSPTLSGVPTIPLLEEVVKEEGHYVFTWSTSTDSEGSDITYDFQMEKVNGGGTLIKEGITEPKIIIENNELSSGSWKWHVTAKDIEGNSVTSLEVIVSLSIQ